jgi:hypothetical protein
MSFTPLPRRIDRLDLLNKAIYPIGVLLLMLAGVYFNYRQDGFNARQEQTDAKVNALQAELKANQAKADQAETNAQSLRETIAEALLIETEKHRGTQGTDTEWSLMASIAEDRARIGDKQWEKAFEKVRAQRVKQK